LPGSSSKSGAGISAEKKHVGRLEDQIQLPINMINQWPINVPKFYSVQTVWAQSGVSALIAMERNDILQDYNVPLLHAMAATFNPDYFLFVAQSFVKYLKFNNKNVFYGFLLFFFGCFYTYHLRAKSLFSRVVVSKFIPTKVFEVNGLSSIRGAVSELEIFLKHSKIDFESVVNTKKPN
jgi:hypothetical protein